MLPPLLLLLLLVKMRLFSYGVECRGLVSGWRGWNLTLVVMMTTMLCSLQLLMLTFGGSIARRRWHIAA